MLDLGYAKSGTDEAFAEPQVGDRFHEMYSFWMYVVHMDGEYVVAMEASPPCTVPDDGRLRRFASHDAFRAAYAYGTIPGYWVQLADRGNDVSGWYEQLLPDLPPEAETVAPVAAPAHAQGLLDVVDGRLARWAELDGLGYQTKQLRRERASALLDALAKAGGAE